MIRPVVYSLLLTVTVCLGSDFVGSGEPAPESWRRLGEGKTRLLYRRYYYETNGQYLQPMYQGKSPSCVGCSLAKALEVLHPGNKFSAEYAFGASRMDYFSPLLMKGSHCKWAVEAAVKHGTIPARDYSLVDINLSTYSAKRASQYGERGPPDELNDIAEHYRISGYHQITSWEELRGAIYTGHPVIAGVNGVSFGDHYGQVRDRGGFLDQEFGWFVDNWAHAMVIIGYSDSGRPGALFLNSWGTRWITGPQRYGDEPRGSFWADKHVIEQVIRLGDVYAVLPITEFK